MIEPKSKQQLEKAIEMANSDRQNLLVQMTDVARKYRVVDQQKSEIYNVTFVIDENGKRYGKCTCPSSEIGRLCKHLAAAAGLNVCLAERGLLSRCQLQKNKT